jgi:hypothetical protein
LGYLGYGTSKAQKVVPGPSWELLDRILRRVPPLAGLSQVCAVPRRYPAETKKPRSRPPYKKRNELGLFFGPEKTGRSGDRGRPERAETEEVQAEDLGLRANSSEGEWRRRPDRGDETSVGDSSHQESDSDVIIQNGTTKRRAKEKGLPGENLTRPLDSGEVHEPGLDILGFQEPTDLLQQPV